MEETAADIVDADPTLILDKLDAWIDGFFRLLPNIAVALVLLAIFIGLGIGVGWLVRRGGRARNRQNLGDVGGSLVKWAIYIAGALLAATIVMPSLNPGDLIAGLGIGSVAIGFAFKDILQNMLAGILILIRQPFSVGDQIVSGGHEGTVERIETRATLIKTYNGRRVVIPNSVIYTDSVIVNTAFPTRRSQYDVGIGCNDDWEEATDLILEAMRSVDGVLPDPAPEVLFWEIADSWNTLRLRWWTDARRSDVVHVHARVLPAVYRALDSNGIDMPYPTQVHLFHDQTEETDGNRKRQREGWPAGPRDVPRTREERRSEQEDRREERRGERRAAGADADPT